MIIYVVDEQGKRINTADFPVTNDGTFGNVEQFMELLETHLVSLGISQAKQVLLLADGAEWIWLRLPPLLQRLGCPAESIVQLLDFYHATEHLHSFTELAFNHSQAIQTWFKTARNNLKQGRTAQLIHQMQEMVEKASERKQLMAEQLAYFTKGQQQGRLNYAQAKVMKLPISSGAIESLIRQVVNLRLKGTGKFWLLHHAECVLHARCQWAALRWTVFCDSILTAMLYPA